MSQNKRVLQYMRNQASQVGSQVHVPGSATGGAGAVNASSGALKPNHPATQVGGQAHVPPALAGASVTSPTTQFSQPSFQASPANKLPAPPSVSTYLNPFSALFKQQNQTGYDNTIGDTLVDANQAISDAGFTGVDTNADGIPDSAFAVDPTNPFSRAALMQRAYDQQKRGISTSMGAQGQFLSGAHQVEQDEADFGQAAGMNQLSQGLEQYLRDVLRKRRDASLGLQQANTGVDYEALVAALNQDRGA